MKTLILIILIIFSELAFSAQTCSRIAIINNQEILVDSNSTDKGEGLRYYFEKDQKALEYLNQYQENSKIIWPNAILGTVGTSMLLWGAFNNSTDRQPFLISGASLVIINFFVAKTLEVTNESNLNKAIDEYNLRNLPKIQLINEQANDKTYDFKLNLGLSLSWSF